MATRRALVLFALLGTCCAIPVTTQTPGDPAPASTLDRAMDATVRISRKLGGEGSGFAWDAHTIVTARHMVASAVFPPTIETRDGQTCTAVGTFIAGGVDVALVFVEGCTLTPIVQGSPARQRQEVWSLGHPFGFDWSASRGVVSAKREGFAFGDLPPSDYLQIDAAVNPGNSGGPLVDAEGRLVGLVMGLASRTGGFDGIAFAVELATIQAVARAAGR